MSVISQTERALSIAKEHADWLQAQGWTPKRLRLAMGRRRTGRPGLSEWTWQDAIDAMVRTWLALR
jgi:hypothetical protein